MAKKQRHSNKLPILERFNTNFCFSPVEKLVEGEGGGLYPGQGPHPPYVPCSGSPGGGGAGAWPASVPGQVPGGHPGYPGLVPGIYTAFIIKLESHLNLNLCSHCRSGRSPGSAESSSRGAASAGLGGRRGSWPWGWRVCATALPPLPLDEEPIW